MLDFIALIGGVGLCVAGGRRVLQASRHGRLGAPGRILPGAVWHYVRHAPEGQRLLREGWLLGGAGVALLVLGAAI
jgi:hypothetical protein